jgi:HEPN domain-containing protein
VPADDATPGSPSEWFERAQSHLAMCFVPKPSAALWEELAFHAHAAAEFAFKAVHQKHGIRFRYTHNLVELGRRLEKAGVAIPEPVKESVILNRYIVQTRYPALPLRVTEEEFLTARRLAETVVAWAQSVLEAPHHP